MREEEEDVDVDVDLRERNPDGDDLTMRGEAEFGGVAGRGPCGGADAGAIAAIDFDLDAEALDGDVRVGSSPEDTDADDVGEIGGDAFPLLAVSLVGLEPEVTKLKLG